MGFEKTFMRLLAAVSVAFFCVGAIAHASPPDAGPAQRAIAPRESVAMPLEAPTDVKFADFFRMPVGAKGMEATEKLLGLNGRRVRIVGYLAEMEAPVADLSYLTPYPMVLGHEDEHLADDLPAVTVFVHSGDLGKPVPHFGGLVRLTGRLAVGPSEEPDGRVSSIRLSLDRETLDSLSVAGLARRKVSAGPSMREHP